MASRGYIAVRHRLRRVPWRNLSCNNSVEFEASASSFGTANAALTFFQSIWLPILQHDHLSVESQRESKYRKFIDHHNAATDSWPFKAFARQRRQGDSLLRRVPLPVEGCTSWTNAQVADTAKDIPRIKRSPSQTFSGSCTSASQSYHEMEKNKGLKNEVSRANLACIEDIPPQRFSQKIRMAIKSMASMGKDDWMKQLSHWKGKIRDTIKHYWLGTKLLWTDIRISSRLLFKLMREHSLSRRERQQLTRTTADIFRLVPFAVIIIVPFMEFLLPVLLKVFPNMLPSTFQDKTKKEEALKLKVNARLQYAKFLQDIVTEMAKEIKTKGTGDVKRTAEDLDEFMSKVRRGELVSNDDILGFAKLFNDELTLDNMSRPRLISMCKYMGIQPYGTNAYLCYMLRSKLAWIKNDDRLIQTEGLESLSEAELQAACRERGMLGLFSLEDLRDQLRNWLDLSLNHSVPSSLLILSRTFTVSGKLKPEEAVQATLSSLPVQVVDSVGLFALPSEDGLAERQRKLEYLKMQEELIKEGEEK